ncbi:MAG: hypothetical protein C4531_03120 [Desulfurivibrio sp.]|nr:MAG: hypothetical protein C4531_03120 [Desulfurivibrio sp.]
MHVTEKIVDAARVGNLKTAKICRQTLIASPGWRQGKTCLVCCSLLTQLSDLIYFAEITIFFDIIAALISVMGIQETGDRIQNG